MLSFSEPLTLTKNEIKIIVPYLEKIWIDDFNIVEPAKRTDGQTKLDHSVSP